ncbi:Ger(x)C family spore germination protein [Bacillus piscicola]|uniref:Ger(x)C family spore germination protein n=1 Tax=Bacillus piscicola TaxID=1632684 RepID=UPI001F08ADF9|nr:Ger(x)C family spore germination protein [Bacillus piscicola]
MNNHKCMLLMLCFATVFLLTGCWDQVSIEDRGFVVATAVDRLDQTKEGNPQIQLTSQFVIPSGLGSPAQGSSDAKPYANISASGDSVYMADQKMHTLTSKLPFLEHLQVLIVSEEVAATPYLFRSIIDLYIREQEMRRGIKVLIAKGSAKDILDIDTAGEKLPANYLDKMLESGMKKTGFVEPVRIGDVHEFLIGEDSYTIPKVSFSEKRPLYEGGAVYDGKRNQLVGMFNPENMLSLNLLLGKSKGMTIKVPFEDQLMIVKLLDTRCTVKINPEKGITPSINIHLELDGHIAEMFGTETHFDAKSLAVLKKAAEEKVETMFQESISKAQHELQVDVFHFGKMMERRHPDWWKKVKDDWDSGESYFAKSTVDVEAVMNIRSTGSGETYQY